MRTVNIHEAKTHLSRLIDAAAKGETIIIARAGKPVVRLTSIDTVPARPPQRLGFLAGRFPVPDDFDRMDTDGIAELFSGDPA
jgi:prevent-host-death family protein